MDNPEYSLNPPPQLLRPQTPSITHLFEDGGEQVFGAGVFEGAFLCLKVAARRGGERWPDGGQGGDDQLKEVRGKMGSMSHGNDVRIGGVSNNRSKISFNPIVLDVLDSPEAKHGDESVQRRTLVIAVLHAATITTSSLELMRSLARPREGREEVMDWRVDVIVGGVAVDCVV